MVRMLGLFSFMDSEEVGAFGVSRWGLRTWLTRGTYLFRIT